MLRGIFSLALIVSAPAQAPQAPVDAAIQAYQTAHSEGRFPEAAAKRDEALLLLNATPPDVPQFAMWVRSVAQLYGNAGRTEQARSAISTNLARLSPSSPFRAELLSVMAASWQGDRNLLEALKYRDQAAESALAAPSAQVGASRSYAVMGRGMWYRSDGSPANSNLDAYQRLADLYLELGRRDAAARVTEKIAALAGPDASAAGSLYERQGQPKKAVELYQHQIDQAIANTQSQPWQIAGPVQNLAILHQRHEEYPEAIAILQKGIAALDATQARSQSNALRQTLADILKQSGNSEASAQTYQQL